MGTWRIARGTPPLKTACAGKSPGVLREIGMPIPLLGMESIVHGHKHGVTRRCIGLVPDTQRNRGTLPAEILWLQIDGLTMGRSMRRVLPRTLVAYQLDRRARALRCHQGLECS